MACFFCYFFNPEGLVAPTRYGGKKWRSRFWKTLSLDRWVERGGEKEINQTIDLI